jgi:hypothetical protein
MWDCYECGCLSIAGTLLFCPHCGKDRGPESDSPGSPGPSGDSPAPEGVESVSGALRAGNGASEEDPGSGGFLVSDGG